MKGMMPLQDKAAVRRRMEGPLPYRGHVRLSTRWVARLTLLDVALISKFLDVSGFWGWLRGPSGLRISGVVRDEPEHVKAERIKKYMREQAKREGLEP